MAILVWYIDMFMCVWHVQTCMLIHTVLGYVVLLSCDKTYVQVLQMYLKSISYE